MAVSTARLLPVTATECVLRPIPLSTTGCNTYKERIAVSLFSFSILRARVPRDAKFYSSRLSERVCRKMFLLRERIVGLNILFPVQNSHFVTAEHFGGNGTCQLFRSLSYLKGMYIFLFFGSYAIK